MLQDDSNPIWGAQYSLPTGEPAWDIGPAWVPSSVTQPHSLLFSTCLGQGTLEPSGISGSMPGGNLRCTGNKETCGVALLRGGEGMGRKKVTQLHTQKNLPP